MYLLDVAADVETEKESPIPTPLGARISGIMHRAQLRMLGCAGYSPQARNCFQAAGQVAGAALAVAAGIGAAAIAARSAKSPAQKVGRQLGAGLVTLGAAAVLGMIGGVVAGESIPQGARRCLNADKAFSKDP